MGLHATLSCLVVPMMCLLTVHGRESGFKERGLPQQPVTDEFRIYSPSNVKVFRDGKRILTTLTPDGHYPDITITVSAFGRKFKLKMLKNRYMFSTSYIEKIVSYDGDSYNNVRDIRAHCYYSGTVNDQLDNMAAVSTCTGIVGYFEFANETYNIEPVDGTLTGRHRVYRGSDSVRTPSGCGVTANGKLNISSFSGNYRKRRSFDWPQDLTGNTKVVELYVVSDYSHFVWLGNNASEVITRTKNIVNIADTLFHQIGVYIVLVGVEIWTDYSLIDVDSADFDGTLRRFSSYRETNINPYYPNDNAHLITHVLFEPNIIGYAWVDRMCSYTSSAGLVSDRSVLPGSAGTVMAHEMGHNMGFLHDDELGKPCDCDDPIGVCIMQTEIEDPPQTKWSSCSKDQLMVSFRRKVDYCLDNIPDILYDKMVVCGNGIVETGEQCDCGNAPSTECNPACCNPYTCRLVDHAACSAGRCCIISTCQVKPMSTVCRPAAGSCDLPEYCSGKDATCPFDAYRQDGSQCSVNGTGAYCYKGRCNTHESQCQLWFGRNVHNSIEECYSWYNGDGDLKGNCGYNVTSLEFKVCASSDVMCGLLHCDVNFGADDSPPFPSAVVSTTWIRWTPDDRYDFCTSAIFRSFYHGAEQQDMGLVPNGAACGDDMMCLSQKCVRVSDLNVIECPDCHEHGVCNNLGQCHCEVGYSPPDCSHHGYGGSIHSNPIVPMTSSQCSTTNIELVFVVDSSTKSNNSDWRKMLTFVNFLIDKFDVGQNAVHVAFVRYSDQPTVIFGLDATQDKASIQSTILHDIQSVGGRSNLAAALDAIRTRVFNTSAVRPDALKVAIVVTDQLPAISVHGLENAIVRARSADIRLYGAAVGYIRGRMIDSYSLYRLSFNGDQGQPWQATWVFGYDDFPNQITQVVQFACVGGFLRDVSPSLALETPSAVKSHVASAASAASRISAAVNQSHGYCSTTNIDMVFVVDSSTKSDSSAWQKMLAFVNSVIDKFSVGQNAVHVAFVRYSDQPTVVFGLNASYDRVWIRNAIQEIEQVDGGSNLAAALDTVRTQVFETSAVRFNGLKVAIVVTDQLEPVSVNGLDTAISNARSANIRMYGVGIGYISDRNIDSYSLYELSFNADQCQPFQATWVYGYDDLSIRVEQIAWYACVKGIIP